MMDKSMWLGVDVGKEEVVAAITVGLQPFSAMRQRTFSHSTKGLKALCTWVEGLRGERELAGVCMEATGAMAWAFVDGLDGRLGPVSMVNPRFISDHRKSLGITDKTDQIDACVIASYGRAVEPAPRAMPSQNQRKLKKLHGAYVAAEADRQAWRNRLETIGDDKELEKSIHTILEAIERTLEDLDTQIQALIESDEQMDDDVKRMTTIPGVADKTARMVLAHLGDLRQYKRNEVTALAGLYPRRFESGTSVYRKPRLAKAGKPQLRDALYFPAITAMKHNPVIAEFAQRLREKGLPQKAIVAAAMRKLLMLIRGVICSGKNFQPA